MLIGAAEGRVYDKGHLIMSCAISSPSTRLTSVESDQYEQGDLGALLVLLSDAK